MPTSFYSSLPRGNPVTVVRPALVVGVVAALAAGPSAFAGQQEARPAAAVIASVEGSALVATSTDIVPALAGMPLEPLNRIFVLEDSSAVVTFSDGCEQQLVENDIVTITSGSGCDAAQIERSATSLATPTGTQSSFAAAAAAPGSPGALLLLGGGAAGGATALGIGTAELLTIAGLGGAFAIIAADDSSNNNQQPPSGAQPSPLPPPTPISPE